MNAVTIACAVVKFEPFLVYIVNMTASDGNAVVGFICIGFGKNSICRAAMNDAVLDQQITDMTGFRLSNFGVDASPASYCFAVSDRLIICRSAAMRATVDNT
jgi:hypothetical protein